MRIACLQFSPQVGDVDNNLNRADSVLSRADPMELENLDLLVLPEMAFSGYNFSSLEHIKPFLEHSGSGISSIWARTVALKYDCTVAVGYPEKMDVFRNWVVTTERYNSLIVVNGDGETVANYRKSHLYYTDDTWAMEGCGFYRGYVPGLGRTAMGICMDINPYKFEAPWLSYEFAFHILDIKANLVIISMAWLTFEDSSEFSRMAEEPDMKTLTYWIQRLEPLIRSESDDEIIVVFCNRCGTEDDVQYTGTSTVVGVLHGEVRVYGLLGRGVKELLYVDTDMPPFASLVNSPDTAEEEREQEEEGECAELVSAMGEPSPIHDPSTIPSADSAWFAESILARPANGAEQGLEAAMRSPVTTRPSRQRPSIFIPEFPQSASGIGRRTTPMHSARTPIAPTPLLPTPEAPTPTPPEMRPWYSKTDNITSKPPLDDLNSSIPSWAAQNPFTPPRSPPRSRTRSASMSRPGPAGRVPESLHGANWRETGLMSAVERSSRDEFPVQRDFHRRGRASVSHAATVPARDMDKQRSTESTAYAAIRPPAAISLQETRPPEPDSRALPWDESPLQRPCSPKRGFTAHEQYQSPQETVASPESAASEANPLQTSITIAADPSIFEKESLGPGRHHEQRPHRADERLTSRPLKRSVSVSASTSGGVAPLRTRAQSRGRRSPSTGPLSGSALSAGPSMYFQSFQNLVISEAEAIAGAVLGPDSRHPRKRSYSLSSGSLAHFDLRTPLSI